MEEHAVFYRGEAVGKVCISEERPYWRVRCECRMVSGEVLRLISSSRGRERSVGVLTPGHGALTLDRRFTASGLPFEKGAEDLTFRLGARTDDRMARRSPDGGWIPEARPESLFTDGDIADACRGAEGVLTRAAGGDTLIAVPFSHTEPFSMMPIFCFGRIKRIGERDYAVFRIRNGQIVM